MTGRKNTQTYGDTGDSMDKNIRIDLGIFTPVMFTTIIGFLVGMTEGLKPAMATTLYSLLTCIIVIILSLVPIAGVLVNYFLIIPYMKSIIYSITCIPQPRLLFVVDIVMLIISIIINAIITIILIAIITD